MHTKCQFHSGPLVFAPGLTALPQGGASMYIGYIPGSMPTLMNVTRPPAARARGAEEATWQMSGW
jgi:hypothetical protein